ncbi:MAG: N-acetyltransferase [Pirellulales bacterium]
MPATFRLETAADRAAIRRVVEAAFGQPAEADLVDALRDEGYVRLSMVAEIAGQVVGHILFSALPIVTSDRSTDENLPALALAPMAVAPPWQRQGVGSQLIRHALDACRVAGHRIVVVLCHPEYYPRFGFSASLARPLESPYAGPAFMALELAPGALANVRGRVEYAEPFGRL